jgi:hypothetical protein
MEDGERGGSEAGLIYRRQRLPGGRVVPSAMIRRAFAMRQSSLHKEARAGDAKRVGSGKRCKTLRSAG